MMHAGEHEGSNACADSEEKSALQRPYSPV